MCLNLLQDHERHVATEDIICFKRLRQQRKLYINHFKSGDSFSGLIKDQEVEGHVSIEDGTLYFCTDNSHLNGSSCSEKYGHSFSWIQDDRVKKIFKHGIEIEPELAGLVTPYYDFPVEIGQSYTSFLNFPYYDNTIEHGLHSFATVEGAYSDTEGHSYNETFVECRIPAGSEYYIGDYGGKVAYASSAITYVKIVK